jgi:3-oxoacyl-[acyl-carrier-protein] synthase-1
MVQPSGEGAARCMTLAMENIGAPVDYINAHATSTPVGDSKELEALRSVFGKSNRIPPFSSTKSLTGHAQGATGVQEAIFSLLMMEHNFISASANVDEPDEALGDMPLVTKRIDAADLNCVMTNSFGFGGTNATLTFRRLDA